MRPRIELTASEAGRLATAAAQEGLDPAELARRLVTEHLPPVAPSRAEADPTLALFAQWNEEDRRMTTEEIEQEQHLWRQFEEEINETRRALGMKRLL